MGAVNVKDVNAVFDHPAKELLWRLIDYGREIGYKDAANKFGYSSQEMKLRFDVLMEHSMVNRRLVQSVENPDVRTSVISPNKRGIDSMVAYVKRNAV